MKRNRARNALVLSAAFTLSLLLLGACTKPGVVPDLVELSESSHSLIAGDETLGSFTLEPIAVLEDRAISDAAFTYEAADPAVVSVSESGVVTALSAGRTTVTATFVSTAEEKVSASCEVLVYEEATAEEINSFDERYVNKFGRIEYKAGSLDLDNVAAAVEVAFYGTELEAKFTVQNTIYGRVYVDGVAGEFAPFVSGDRIVLAEGLPEGIHTVRIVKSSEINEGRLTVNAFYADRFLAAPEHGGPKIEFIGDSITCGYGDLIYGGPDIVRSIENSDACLAFAYLTADLLDARYSVIAYSGICVAVDVWGAGINMTTLHTYASYQTKHAYEYDRDMDVVVLGLGTNDASYINQPGNFGYRRQFPADYLAFVTHLRDIYPDAYIVCVYGMMGTVSEIHKGIRNAVEELGDPKVVYKTFAANNSGVNSHPYRDAHAAYAKQLSAYISGLLEN